MKRRINDLIKSSEERRRSSRISELEARNGQRSLKEIEMTFDSEDEESDHKRVRKKVKTRPLQDLISDPVERQAHVVEPQAKKLLSDAFRSVERRTNATNPMGTRTPLPDQNKIELLLNILQRRDSKKIFAEPVDPKQVKGYKDVVAEPMDFATIGIKIGKGKYNALEDLEHDVFLVFDNAMKFNQSSTVYYRQARAIREVAEKLFHGLKTDPENFERHFFPASLRCGRWTKAEARLLNSTDMMISSGRKGKRHEDSVDQRRQTYQPPGEEKSLASDVPKNTKTLVEAKEGLDYNESLNRFLEDLGPMVKFVATRKLVQSVPQGSAPQNEVPHLQTQAVTFDFPKLSQGSFHQAAAARTVHQNVVPKLSDHSYRNPTQPPHLNLDARSSNFYGGNVMSLGGMNRSEDVKFTIPEASHTLYPTHQTGQGLHYMNKGLDIGNNSERNMTLGIPNSSSFNKPAAATPYGNPNPFAKWNMAPDPQESSFSMMMRDAMKTDGLTKLGGVVSSYPGMQETAAKNKGPLLPSWQEPSQGASPFPGLQAPPSHEESPLRLGQWSNWLSPTYGGSSIGAGRLPHRLISSNKGSSIGAGQLPHWLSQSDEGSSIGAGPVPNWLSLGHAGGSDQVSNSANPATSQPQFFDFLCPLQSGPVDVDVMEQAAIPKPQDQGTLHDARLGSVFDVQDARTYDPKGKSVMENEASTHRPSPSSNIPKWFRG